MKHLLIGRTRNLWVQLLRYAAVGGGAACVDAGTLFILYHWLGVHPLWAAGAGFLLGLAMNYLVSIAWVFESQGKMRREITLFAAIGLGGLGLTELILWMFVDLWGAPVMAAKAIALVIVLGWNFGMRRKFVFQPAAS